MQKFRKIYNDFSNDFMDLTVCTAIDTRVFYIDSIYKPIPYVGIPPRLMKLAFDIGVFGAAPQDELLQDLAKLSNLKYHPHEIQETLDHLKEIYEKIKEDPTNRGLINKFLALWSTIPSNQELLKPKDEYSYNREARVNPLQHFISQLQNYIGISQSVLKALLERGETCSFSLNSKLEDALFALYKRHPRVYDSQHYHPEHTFEDLKPLKVEIDELKKLHQEEIEKRNHEILKFSKALDIFLSTPRAVSINIKDLNFDEIKQKAEYTILAPLCGIVEKIAAFKDSLAGSRKDPIVYFEQVLNHLLELKSFLITDVLACKSLCSDSKSIANQAYILIEEIEVAIAHTLLKEKDNHPQAVLKLISRIAISQNFLKEEPRDFEHLETLLKKVRSESTLGYQKLRQNIINSPDLLETLEKAKLSLDHVVQDMQTNLHVGLTSALEQLLEPPSVRETLSGFATQSASVLGKIRVILPGEDFEPAKDGEILVIQNAAPEIHKYAKASAIISAQGGIFSHAAITFTEMKIPSLLGCEVKLLKELNGKYVHLQLSKESTLTELPQDAVEIIENFSNLTLETAEKLEKLPPEIRSPVADRFYQCAFEKFSAENFVPFMKFPLAQKYFEKEKDSVQGLEKRLWKAENLLERGNLLDQIERKLNKLLKITQAWNSDAYKEIEQKILDFQIRSSKIEAKRTSFGVSGKKENLDRLKETLPQNLKHFEINIPSYKGFRAKNLIWDMNPELKIQIQKILESPLTHSEQSQRITQLLSNIKMDESLLGSIQIDGDLIVRSSARLEDQGRSAAAGIFSSIVVKDRKDFSQAFRDVLISAFSERALAYYAKLTLQDKEAIFDMGWIVQHYVSDGECSGVAFSVADSKNWDIAGLQLVNGLGGGVDGTQTPIHVLIDTKDQSLTELQMKAGEKLLLKLDEIKELASLMKTLEEQFNAPVEIEFVRKGKQLSIVQLRPITTYHFH